VKFTNTARKEKTMSDTAMIKIRQNVRMGMLAALAFLCLLAPRLAAAAQEVVNVQFDNAAGIVDLQLLRDGSKIVSAFAIETQRNTPWLAKTDGLTVAADGRITGTISLTQTPDLLALLRLRSGKSANKDAKAPPVLTEEVSLDVVPKGGKVEGTVKTAAAKSALLGAAGPVTVRGSVYPQAPATESLIELLPFGVNFRGPSAMEFGELHGGLIVHMRVREGKVERAKVFVPPGPGVSFGTSFEVSAAVGQAIVEGNKLKGALTLTKADKSPVEGVLGFEGIIIGDYAVGLAKWESDGVTDETAFRARVSRHQPFPSLQVGERTWEPNGKPLEPDAALAAKALEESLQPIRPGEPGKQPFYNTRPIHLGKYFALHAPTIAFNEVPGAVKYRVTALGEVNWYRQPQWDEKGPRSVSCELEKPWMPLTSRWKEASVGQLYIIATGLDAAGKDIGQAEFPGKAYKWIGGDPMESGWGASDKLKNGIVRPGGKLVPVTKMAPFAGPYWAPNRTAKEGALAAARAVRDDDALVDFRNLCCWRAIGGEDGAPSPIIAAFARACVAIAVLSDNPEERREALALAERAAWYMYSGHRGGRLPSVYKGNVCLMIWTGLAYLDLYAVGKDPRFRDAALDLAGALAAAQDPEDGAWPGRDKKTGKKLWPGGVFGPTEQRTNGGEAVLWFLGRLRKELGVEEFIQNEAKANKWVQTYCLPEMFWQNVGWHSLEMIPVQDTVAPHALSYCTWQLDYADAKDKDLKQVIEIARWCEERHVNWQRQTDATNRPNQKPAESRPSCWGWSRAAGTGIRVAGSLVYVWTRLWQETKDPLWKAKADALAQSILVAQDPVDGGLAYHFNRSTADTTGGHTYDMIDAAYRLMDYSRFTAAPAR
jgi:hypothetical protein